VPNWLKSCPDTKTMRNLYCGQLSGRTLSGPASTGAVTVISHARSLRRKRLIIIVTFLRAWTSGRRSGILALVAVVRKAALPTTSPADLEACTHGQRISAWAFLTPISDGKG